MTTPSYAAKLRGGAGGGGSRFFSDSRPPVQDPPLHHVPALSENAVFIDLRVIKPSVDQVERNDFLLKDLQVSVDEIADIWPEPESQLLRLVFFTAEQHQRYLTRLTAGVPWAACNGALVYGWAPGDAVTAVRLTGVPANLPEAAIRAHFAQFGRVTRVFRSKDKVFTRACNGIVHISIAVAPGFALPAFVSLVDDDGTTDKRMLVHTDAFRRFPLLQMWNNRPCCPVLQSWPPRRRRPGGPLERPAHPGGPPSSCGACRNRLRGPADRRRQRSGGSGFLNSIILYNARRRLSQWECCRR